MKYAADRYCADPEKAARKLVEIANAVEPYMDQRVLIELINGPFLRAGGSPADYRAGLDLAIAKGWLWRHESGTYVKFTSAGAGAVRLAANGSGAGHSGARRCDLISVAADLARTPSTRTDRRAASVGSPVGPGPFLCIARPVSLERAAIRHRHFLASG
jgi:hypothetical protein